MARHCFQTLLKIHKAKEVPTMEQMDQREMETSGGPIEQLLYFPLEEDLTKMVQVGTLLVEEERNRLLDFP